jgi:transcriptional regulator with XRE-family HTH domain
MSSSDLSGKSTLSISYLNEIESGKKYPTSNKIALLANALGVSYDKMVSLKLSKNMAPIGELLESNILKELPLDHYGIDVNKFLQLMSKASLQLSALVSTVIEMAKSSELSQNNFSRTAIRTYKEFNENYFEDIEESVEKFCLKNKYRFTLPIKYSDLMNILKDKFHYEVDEKLLSGFNELRSVRGIVVFKNGSKKIMINNRLTDSQKAFIAGKEIAYNYLNISDRSFIYSDMKVDSFDQLLNNMKASYFSSALIIKKNNLIKDLNKFFSKKECDSDFLISLLGQYNASPDMLFQRITNLLSIVWNINCFFFIRFDTPINSAKYHLIKELRLNAKAIPGSNQNNEHYCRRLIPIKLLQDLEKQQAKNKTSQLSVVGIQKSKFFYSNDEYLTISIAKNSTLFDETNYSVTLGFLLNDDLKKKINFWNDPGIPGMIVNETCERCQISDCKERVESPKILESKTNIEKIERTLKKITEEL